MTSSNPLAPLLELKEELLKEIEEFKKVSESGLIKAITQYRITLLELSQSGVQVGQALWKIGERHTADEWGGEFCKRSVDLEMIEKDRNKMQAKIWDNMLLPLINGEETNKKEFENVEKKLKTLSNQIESNAKKERANFKKLSKKGQADESQFQATIANLVEKQKNLNFYFEVYKEQRYHQWLKLVTEGFEAQKNHYQKAMDVIGNKPWEQVTSQEPPALEDLTELISSMPIGISTSPVASSRELVTGGPSSPRQTEPVEPEVQDVSKYWEELSTDGITYYHNSITKETKWERPSEMG